MKYGFVKLVVDFLLLMQDVTIWLFPDPFLKSQNWAYLWINSLRFAQFVSIACPSQGLSKTLKLSFRLLAFASYIASLKNKKWPGTSIVASFFAWVLKETISLVAFCQLTKFKCLVVFTSWNVRQYVLCNFLFPRLLRHKFWN